MPENPTEHKQGTQPSFVIKYPEDVARWWKLSLKNADEAMWETVKIQPDDVSPVLELCGIHRRMENGQYARVKRGSDSDWRGGQTTFPSEMASMFKKAIIEHLSLENLKPKSIRIEEDVDWTTLTFALPEGFPEIAGPIVNNIATIGPSNDRWGNETFVQTTLIKAAEEEDPEKKGYYEKLLQKFEIDELTMLAWSSVAAGSRLNPAPEKYKERVPKLASTLRVIFPDMEKDLGVNLESALKNPGVVLEKLKKINPKQVKKIWGSLEI